jgi:hypothetical protein
LDQLISAQVLLWRTMLARREDSGREPAGPQLEPSSRFKSRSTVILTGVLLVVCVLIVKGIDKGEFSYNIDETQHAVTGLYVADLIRDHPLSHPVEYTYRYYAQYPALAGVIHWPPLYYVVEGISFLAFGPTVVAARLSIAGFALFGLFFWYRMVEELQDSWTAALSVILLALLPVILLFEKTVMLEIPSMSLCIAASYFWVKYLRQQRARHMYWFAVLASCAMLTKQNSVYLGLFCLLSVLALNKWRELRLRHVLIAFFICLCLVFPFYTLVYVVHWKTVAMDLTDTKISGIAKYLFYWMALPRQLGWLLLPLSILGLVMSWRWDSRSTTLLMLSWIASCYVTFTLIGWKEARYTIYWLPPFVYFASGLLTKTFRIRWLQSVGAAVAVVLVATSVASAWYFQRPYVDGYAAAARRITTETDSAIILYDGELPGNFIFFIRAYGPDRRFLVLRKALYTYRIKQSGGFVELLHTRDEIESLMRRDGVRFVVVSDAMRLAFDSQRELRELLKQPQFRLLAVCPVLNSEAAGTSNLLIYENLAWAPPTDKYLRIKMLTLNHDILVPLDMFAGEKKQNTGGGTGKGKTF